MSRKRITKTKSPKKINRERDPIPWKYCFLTLICGLILVAGFFGAAHQHFSSVDLGIKNSKLRKQIEELEADQRRLLLTKEIVLSPAEIKKAAKKIGFTEMSASNIEVLRNSPEAAPRQSNSNASNTAANKLEVPKPNVKDTDKQKAKKDEPKREPVKKQAAAAEKDKSQQARK